VKEERREARASGLSQREGERERERSKSRDSGSLGDLHPAEGEPHASSLKPSQSPFLLTEAGAAAAGLGTGTPGIPGVAAVVLTGLRTSRTFLITAIEARLLLPGLGSRLFDSRLLDSGLLHARLLVARLLGPRLLHSGLCTA
jgi:hypothetical protein